MTKEIANYILKCLDYSDYDITDIYESSFRAIRKNEWILSELNVEYMGDIERGFYIDTDNVYSIINVCTHVLKRYK